MSNQDKPQVIEHIIYPFTPITKEIFFKDVISHQKEIFLDNKKIACQQISDKMVKFLESKGFIVKATDKKQLSGRNKIYGINISVSPIKNGTEIKEIMITINAQTQEVLTERKKTIINGVKSITNVKCKTSTSDKFVRC